MVCRWVESSFWNFDSLFQPQSHPARDAHDTFFIKDPASTLTVRYNTHSTHKWHTHKAQKEHTASTARTHTDTKTHRQSTHKADIRHAMCLNRVLSSVMLTWRGGAGAGGLLRARPGTAREGRLRIDRVSYSYLFYMFLFLFSITSAYTRTLLHLPSLTRKLQIIAWRRQGVSSHILLTPWALQVWV